MTSNLIYIVEDDSSIRELEKYALLNSGFTVEGFDNSKELYNALGTNLPDTGTDISKEKKVPSLYAKAKKGTKFSKKSAKLQTINIYLLLWLPLKQAR